MGFSTEIVRGVRLAAILFAVGLVGITLYRMLDLVDDDDSASASTSHSVAAAAPAKPLKPSGPKFYPPPPPPLPGRAAVVAKPVQHQSRDIVVVDVPAARDSSTVAAADLTAPVLEPRLDPVAQAAIAEPLADVPAAPAAHRNNRFVRAFHRVVKLVKPN